MRITLLITAFLTTPMMAAASSNSPVLPQGQSITKVTENPYFHLGLNAAGKGLKTFSVTVNAQPQDSLAERVNLIHLGLGMSGWKFTAQSSIDGRGSTQFILLTYQR